MNEISDEFKIVVVDAIKTLCLKYKQKHRTLMNFLSNMLRDEGGFQYKKAIVETILVIIAALPEAKEAGNKSNFIILFPSPLHQVPNHCHYRTFPLV